MAAKYEVKKSKNNKFYFNLKAGNGEIILTSEMYNDKSAAMNGIDSVRKNSGEQGLYEAREQKDGAPYFILKAKNHQEIGRSEAYSSKSSMTKGINSVMKNGPVARIVDLTVAESK